MQMERRALQVLQAHLRAAFSYRVVWAVTALMDKAAVAAQVAEVAVVSPVCSVLTEQAMAEAVVVAEARAVQEAAVALQVALQ